MHAVGKEIKERIKNEVGDWLTVSIGLGTSRFIAKKASELKKPDGLEENNYTNVDAVYQRLQLEDLNGINVRNKLRLNLANIYTVTDMYHASITDLKAPFNQS